MTVSPSTCDSWRHHNDDTYSLEPNHRMVGQFMRCLHLTPHYVCSGRHETQYWEWCLVPVLFLLMWVSSASLCVKMARDARPNSTWVLIMLNFKNKVLDFKCLKKLKLIAMISKLISCSKSIWWLISVNIWKGFRTPVFFENISYPIFQTSVYVFRDIHS